MAEPSENVRELIRRLWSTAGGTGLTPAQAKLYSNHVRLSLGQPGLGSFVAREAAAHLEEAEQLLESAGVSWDGRNDSERRAAVKRSGELLEWLAHDGIQTDGIPAALLAAAAYQIAGFSALAHGLLAQERDDSDAATLTKLFLQADFPGVFTSTRELLAALPDGKGPEASELDERIVVEVVRCFAVVAAFMRWGDDDRLPKAIEKLRVLASLTRHSATPHSAMTARLCVLVAEEYAAANIWPQLHKLGSQSTEAGRLAFLRFGRTAYRRRRSLAWPSQVKGIERLTSGESFVLCTPTGSGKTTVAELALIGDLLGRSDADELDPLALYLVPSRALAAEVEERLASDLRALDTRVVVTGLYGGTDWGPTDAWLTSDAPTLLICTYEKAEALLRFLGPIFMRRVRVVVVDEAHSVQFEERSDSLAALRTSENRGLRLEILAVRLLRALEGCAYRLIALSAVTAGLEASLARWLVGKPDAEPARSDYRSTRQLIGRLECVPGGTTMIRYDLLDRALLTVEDAGDAPYVPNPFPRCPASPSFDGKGSPLTWLRPFVAWAAFQLAKRDAHGQAHSVLISITSHIEHYTTSFLTLLEKDWLDVALPEFFEAPTDPYDVRIWNDCLATLRDYFTTESPEYRLLLRGIAVHHGKMPAPLARRLKTIIEKGIVRVVLATSTLSEGVNLPVEYVLVPDVHRGNTILKPQEFLNLVGRAGRPGHGTEGRTLVVLPRRTTRSEYNVRRLGDGYGQLIGQIRQDRGSPPSSPESPLARLIALLKSEWTKLAGSDAEDDFHRWLESEPVPAEDASEDAPPPAVDCLDTLDGVLLAMVEELQQLQSASIELSTAELETFLRQVWQRTFAKVASAREEELEAIFLRRGLAVPTLYPDRTERRRIYKTSLPPASARSLLARIDPIRQHLESGAHFSVQSVDERYAYVERAVELIAAMRRFAPSAKVGQAKVAWKAVLRWWLDPAGSKKTPKPEQVGAWHEYANKNFTYKINWALGSLVSLSLDTPDSQGALIALSFDDWPKSGLPWAAFWLKELLTWGTLEPVIAFLMARNLVVTREEAAKYVADYYASQSGRPENDALDPRSLRDWASGLGLRSPSRQVEEDSWRAEIVVDLEQRNGWVSDALRVLPVVASEKETVEWLDVAGYVVASSSRASLDPTWEVDQTDFVLNVRTSIVVVTPYL